ncbi:type II toxin-antitoxin system VapB family antitoxin [Nitrospirillum sp. BR 11828]|uniref:type II toxin-antitoxin system VapB family antitoxin n=1 Tax=Nitrospirillum sp. BR 11828 TaxID=3104325 RepID=UPI002ACA0625|nr:type II toxin-antitoxin system VapB family antitoxin [Nitrospirillum sp. BR 11828]MDZ5645732.1 type II toxin-antitoxin system VapB family antitoxin [Nitrospirillum sp. BR 11828]
MPFSVIPQYDFELFPKRACVVRRPFKNGRYVIEENTMNLAVDADTERFALRLARLRGVSVEQAVGAAVRAELARAERATNDTLTSEQRAKVEQTMAMVAGLPRLSDAGEDPSSFLYDEHGLPR